MAKYKATGCARFLIFMVIIIPIAFFGAQYLSDNGMLDQIKEKVDQYSNKEFTKDRSAEKEVDASEFNEGQIKRQIAELLNKIEEQQGIIEEQEGTITKQQGMIDQLMKMRGQEATATVPVETQPVEQKKTNPDGPSLEDLLKEADKAIKKNGEN